MSHIPNKVMPHISRREPARQAPKSKWRELAGRLRKLLGSRGVKLGMAGAATAAVLVPLTLARSTAKR